MIGPRRPDPADAQPAPGELAQRPDGDDPVAGVECGDRRGAVDAQGQVGGEVLDDLETVFGRQARPARGGAISGITAPVGFWNVGTT